MDCEQQLPNEMFLNTLLSLPIMSALFEQFNVTFIFLRNFEATVFAFLSFIRMTSHQTCQPKQCITLVPIATLLYQPKGMFISLVTCGQANR